ncbi:MAG: NADH-quinone oxidoreductase subunit M [Mycobacterium sp.]
MTTMPLLSMLWAVPIVAALIIVALPPSLRATGRDAGLLISLGVLGIAIACAVGFDPAGERFQFVENHTWIPYLGTRYVLGLDGIALDLVVLTAALVPLLMIAGWRDAERSTGRGQQAYVALILAVEGMVMLSLSALDILLFYVFFEAMLVPMYFLIGGFGGPQRARAAVKFLLYNLLGGLIMLIAVVGIYVVTSNSGAFTGGTFDFRQITDAISDGSLRIEPGVAAPMFLAFMFAFAVKAPLWPLHRWLPDAAVQATPASAVLMMAVMDKVGTFGMLRYCLTLFGDAATQFRTPIIILAVISIVYGAVVAIGQTDVMRLIAYTSISHFGFIILGIFAMTTQGQSGSALYMVSHGVSTAALFLIAGFLVSRRGTRAIAAYGGVQKVAPVMAGTFLIAGLATLSLPGLASFISEFLVLIGTFTRYPLPAVIAAAALVLSAIYVLWLYQRMMTGPVTHGNEKLPDLRARELLVVVPLIAALIALGVYPKIALNVINPAVNHTLEGIHVTDPVPTLQAEVPR